MAKRTQLTLVEPGGSGLQPPRDLGKPGKALWDKVQAEYDVSDVAGTEILAQACAALSQAEDLRAEIKRDGPVLRDRRGMIKDHPALKHELAARAFVVRALTKLGLNFEPLRAAPGRPPNGDFA
jgi:P27 family predicted phage terminase small subunit